jgi:Flp pilus assembly protein TadD
MYEADYGDPAKAVVMAQSELAARKDVYGWDAYAWALHRSARAREAADAARHAVSRGTQDPMLDAHAGMIFAASEEPEQARLYLARALTANPHFHVFRAEEARAQGARPAP